MHAHAFIHHSWPPGDTAGDLTDALVVLPYLSWRGTVSTILAAIGINIGGGDADNGRVLMQSASIARVFKVVKDSPEILAGVVLAALADGDGWVGQVHCRVGEAVDGHLCMEIIKLILKVLPVK